MKRYLLGLSLIITLVFSGCVFGQTFTTIAEDDASNYSGSGTPNFGLNINDNGGSGFNSWTWADSGTSRSAFLGHGPNDDHGDIGNPSFGLFADTGGNTINAFRSFDELNNGDVFEVEFTINFRDGAKGVEIFKDGTGVFLFQSSDAFGDKYEYRDQNGDFNDTGWPYQANSIFKLTIKQLSENNIDITVERTNSTGHSVTLANVNVSGRVDEVRFFNLDAGGGEQNFYFNNLKIERPTYTTIADGDFSATSTWENGDIPNGNGIVNINHDVVLDEDFISTGEINIAEDKTLAVNEANVLTNNGTININGDLVFKSNASNTAQYGNSSGTIVGDVTVERFIPSRRAFRFLSSPVGSVDIAEAWQQQIHITGEDGLANGFDDTATNNPSMFVYNHNIEDQVNNNAWVAVTSTNQNLEAGKPYRIMVRGDRETVDLSSNDSPSSDVTLSATGNLHTGDFDVEISDYSDNFTFVGNPYQAVVDLNEVSFGNDVNTSFIYYWDASLGDRGAFATIELPAGTSISNTEANEFLRPGQAFFIRNNDSGSDFSIQFNEDSKAVSGDQTQVFSSENNALGSINIRLYTQEAFANNLKEQDALGLRFSAEGNNAVDYQDAVKMINLDENLASLNNDQLLSIENRNLPENEEEIQLITQGYTSDSYVFWADLQNLPEGTTAFLKDAYTDELTELENGINEIPFNVDSAIEESSSLFRFTIEFDVETFSNQDFESLGVEIYPNPVSENLFINLGELQSNKTHISIFDVAGRKVIQQQVKADESLIQVDVAQLQSGLYFVEVQEDGKKFTKKLIKK